MKKFIKKIEIWKDVKKKNKEKFKKFLKNRELLWLRKVLIQLYHFNFPTKNLKLKKIDLKFLKNEKFNLVKESLKVLILEIVKENTVSAKSIVIIEIVIDSRNHVIDSINHVIVTVTVSTNNLVYLHIVIHDASFSNVLDLLIQVELVVVLVKKLNFQDKTKNLIKKSKTNLKYLKKHINLFPKEKTFITNQNNQLQLDLKNKFIQMRTQKAI